MLGGVDLSMSAAALGPSSNAAVVQGPALGPFHPHLHSASAQHHSLAAAAAAAEGITPENAVTDVTPNSDVLLALLARNKKLEGKGNLGRIMIWLGMKKMGKRNPKNDLDK